MDCEDLSDEDDCRVVKIFPGYNKLLAPPPMDNDSKLKINISLNLDKIIAVDENGGNSRPRSL